jgi:ATP-dependent DNA helicase RecQ
MATPREVLQQQFGFRDFRPGQEDVIGHLMAGRSAAAVFPTGSGKSLCYQLPATLLPGLSLVVSPLIALMKDQLDRLRQLGIAAERLDSTLDAQQSADVMRAVRDGQLRMLYVAPERFNNERFREAIKRTRLSLFAVDEAHFISEWGHNFRPDYLKLARLAREYGAERVLALTATATPQVLDDICHGFHIDPACAVRTGFYRPNLRLLTTPVAFADRDAMLLDRLRTRPPGPTIVYVTLQRTAEGVAQRLAAAGFPARAYHAGMEDADRAAVQDWFFRADRAVVVATIAFGMGIDKADIRYLYHYNLPKSLENYSQEIGRAGRDGELAICEMFVCLEDLNTLENFTFGDTPGLKAVQGLVAEVLRQGEELELSLYDLSARHDVRQLVTRTLLTYLELDGFLLEGTPFYAQYRFRPLVPSADILARFEGERREFLRTLLAQAQKAKTWFHIDLDRAAQATASPRDRVVRALDYLGEQQLLELQAEGVRHRFRRLRIPQDLDALGADLHRRTLERERREIARLHQVVELIGHAGCQVSHLGAHFGQPLPQPCGHCSWCLNGRRAVALPPRPRSTIDESAWTKATQARREHADALADPRAFVRFLCGLSSPKLTRARLSSHPLFGVCAEVPFPDVLRRVAGAA